MRRFILFVPIALSAGLLLAQAPQSKGKGTGPAASPVPQLEETGFKPIFDGSSLKGWDCDPDFWKVVDGAMVGETTATHQPPQNIFCIWKGDQPADFELKLQYRLTGASSGNSGIQYRSMELPEVAKWVLKGYQFDIDAQQNYTGQLYEERNRGFLTLRGQISYIPLGKKAGSIGSTGDSDQLKSFIKLEDWNDVHIIARGNVLTHLINGHVMSVTIDDDLPNRRLSGAIGIQLHKTPNAMKMETRNIRLKTF